MPPVHRPAYLYTDLRRQNGTHMDTVNILYRLKFKKSDRVEEFNFELDDQSFELIDQVVENPPSWTELGYRQCPHCPARLSECRGRSVLGSDR